MTAPQVKATILNAGKTLVNGALTGYSKFAPHSFLLGSGSGHDVDKDRTTVVGSLAFTGTTELITARQIADDTVRYTMTIPEGVGPITFGSVILNAVGFDGRVLPYIEISLPFTFTKEVADPIVGNGNPFPKPGSRLIITAIVKHTVVESDSDTIQVIVTAPSFANMAFFDNEFNLPSPESQPWNQFVLTNHTNVGAPVLVTKRADSTYWGVPYLQSIHHPRFGHYDGGDRGDNYQTNQHRWVWSRNYRTPKTSYKGQVGGYGYKTLTISSPSVIGGSSYKAP